MLSTMATPNSASKTPRYGQRQTLVLNADYTPLSVTTAVRALMLEVSNKATVLETSGGFVRSEFLKLATPSVIVLASYVPHRGKRVRSDAPTLKQIADRDSIFRRDDYECQYCAAEATTIDHVLPRSKGGTSTWENQVACCSPCNAKKGNKLLAQTSMKLRKKPGLPTESVTYDTWVGRLTQRAGKKTCRVQSETKTHGGRWGPKYKEEWSKYLGGGAEMEQSIY